MAVVVAGRTTIVAAVAIRDSPLTMRWTILVHWNSDDTTAAIASSHSLLAKRI